jgi:hypothetical protein
MATAGRFAALNSEEKDAVLENINAKNTKRQNMDLDFENCSLEHLDQTLSYFYMEMRNKKGDMYSKIHTSIVSAGHPKTYLAGKTCIHLGQICVLYVRVMIHCSKTKHFQFFTHTLKSPVRRFKGVTY